MAAVEPPGLRKCTRISPSSKYPKLNSQVVYFVHHVYKISSAEKVMKPPRLLIGTANLLYQTNTANMDLYSVTPIEHIERLKIKCEPGVPDEILIAMNDRCNDSDMHMQLLTAEGNEPASSAGDLCEIIRSLRWRLTGKDIPIEKRVGKDMLSRGAHKKKSPNYMSSDKKLKMWKQQMQAPTSPYRKELVDSVRTNDALRERPPFNVDDDVIFLDFGPAPWGIHANVLTVQGVIPGSQFDKLGGRHLVGRHIVKANNLDIHNPIQLEPLKAAPIKLGFGKVPLPPPSVASEEKSKKSKKKSRKSAFEDSSESEEMSDEEDSEEYQPRRGKKKQSQRDLRKASAVSYFPTEVPESPKSSVAMQVGSGLVDTPEPYPGQPHYGSHTPPGYSNQLRQFGDPNLNPSTSLVVPQPQKPVKINLHLNFVQCPQQDSRIDEYYTSEEEEREERRARRAERRERRREKKDHYKQQLQLMSAQNQLLLMQQQPQQRMPSASPSAYSDNKNYNNIPGDGSHFQHSQQPFNPFSSSSGLVPLDSPVYAPPSPSTYNTQHQAPLPLPAPQLQYFNSSQQHFANPNSSSSSFHANPFVGASHHL
eukprot:TRINITY_DN1430_c1_g1_i1.p1 TRINITY_DN1430_c1_g1~~TRINITY_DN1430_c1_g1_i1.p1  ORF type:complete len:592 (+),score=100.43 TRINITY_DN1430_c1_g1_i1:103-1878(+)